MLATSSAQLLGTSSGLVSHDVVHGNPPASDFCVLGLQRSAAGPGLPGFLLFPNAVLRLHLPSPASSLSHRLLAISVLHQLLSCLTRAPLHSPTSHSVQNTLKDPNT